MTLADKNQLRRSRMMLQNPYAHIEHLEELHLSRRYENPYVFAEQGDAELIARKSGAATDIKTIEQIVTKLQRELWRRRREFGLSADAHPVDVLNPQYAARILGYGYSSKSNLGWIPRGRGQGQIIVAGVIDHARRLIEIATDNIEPRSARFTGAHEVAHAVLHPHQTGLHRDRPLGGEIESRDRTEYEADKFAAFFLMPRKHVTDEFLRRFFAPFELQEGTSFALLGKPLEAARQIFPTRRKLSQTIAGAAEFNGKRFTSLAAYFGVGIESMAIRLEELELVLG